MNKERIREIVREELAAQTADCPPDPAPQRTIEDELRELVEKHECLSRELKWKSYGPEDDVPWYHKVIGQYMPNETAILIVRGIVKAMCDERGYGWAVHRCYRNRNKWVCWANGVRTMHPTELAAIDALLTAMEERE